MTKTKSTKRALGMSAMALFLCFTMLLGTTFAWFTDSVTSANNVIKSGTLNVEMYWAEGEAAVPTNKDDWTDASTGAIFDYDKWEPGYAVVRHIKIANEGTLALKYKLAIVANGKVSDLADVIDVYYVDPAVQVADRAQLTDANKLGTLTEVLANLANTANGELPAGESDTITIALKMQETAGNEYQNKSIGTSFSVQLLATQLTYEKDSFDNDYDKDAAYPEFADAWDGSADTSWYNDTDTTFALSTAEELAGFAELVNNGNKFSKKTIVLESDMDLKGKPWTPIASFAGTLDGNEHTISNFGVDATTKHGGFIDVLEWGTVKNLTLTNVNATVGDYRFGVLARSINQSNIDNVTVKDVNVTTTAPGAFVAGLFAHGTVNSNMEVNNCTVENLTVNAEAGAYLIGGITTFVQKNGTEADGTNIFENLNVKNFKVVVNDTDGVCRVGGLVGQTQSVWQNPRFNNCSVTGLDITATGKVDVGGFICYPGSVTFAENCTAEGKIDVSGVTSADNFAGGFFANYGWGDNIGKGDHKVTSCSADVDITTKYASAGGFVGSGTNYEGLNRNITLTNCKALGTVTLVEGGTANIGGFAGQTDRGIYINCSAAQDPFIGKVLDGYVLNYDGNGTLTVTK